MDGQQRSGHRPARVTVDSHPARIDERLALKLLKAIRQRLERSGSDVIGFTLRLAEAGLRDGDGGKAFARECDAQRNLVAGGALVARNQ
ncbi:MAG TPA: hypothetical protein VGV59_10715 [Pyrinomonadaceae bacterium]|nr:hypothetical protein [Pyrinomonadaceae bacterium]